MDAIFQRLLDYQFSELKGTKIHGSIAVPESLINELILTVLKGNPSIAALQVKIHSQNRASVHMKTTLLPWSIGLKLKLDNSVDLASYSSPKLRAWLENNRLLGSLGSFFKVLPEGIKLYGDQVVVDLGSFLRTPQQKRMLDLVKSVDIRTEEGRVILVVNIEVQEKAASQK